MRCEKCGFDFDSNLDRCPKCGASVEFSGNTMFYRRAKESHVKFGEIFSGTFRKHPAGTAAKIFIAGTPETTPTPDKMLSVWQKPWLYSRFLIAGILATAAFLLISIEAAGVFGSLIFPFAVLMFIWEMNIPRDISFIKVIMVFAVGGIVTCVAAGLINSVVIDDFVSLAAFTEEPIKLLMTLVFLHRFKGKYGFSGMLIGAAVGAGFAAFETIEYVFMEQGVLNLYTLVLRSVLAIGGHVTWAAIAGAAAALGRKGRSKGFRYLASPLFWGCFVADMTMHFTWNLGIGLYVNIILCIVAVAILFVMTNLCLKQVVRIYDEARNNVINRIPDAYGEAPAAQPSFVQSDHPHNMQAGPSEQGHEYTVPAAALNGSGLPVSENAANNMSQPGNDYIDPQPAPVVQEPAKPRNHVIVSEFLGIEKTVDKIINIGRDSSFCDIVFPADTAGISRKHCAVNVSSEGLVYVMDLGSTMGTYLSGGRKINPHEWVVVDDSFYVASEKYTFVIR